MKKTYQRIIIITFLLTLLILYTINSTLIIKSIIDYTKLFYTKLFSTNFIFFMLSTILIDQGLIELINNKLKLNGSIFYVTIMSILSGIPSGSKYTKDLLDKGLISNKTANYLLSFTHFPNPMFVLNTVTILLNKTLALKILICLILSNLIIALIFKPPKKEVITINDSTSKDFSESLSKAIIDSLKVILIIYGTSVFFYLITVIINKYLTLNVLSHVLLNGIFDLTKGLFSISLLSNKLLKSLLIIIFFSFGSLSIHIQIKSIITNTSLKYKYFILGRLLQILFATILFLLSYFIY
ncbi:nucleoside recognition domain protein [Mycoplasma sp. CAG:877]|nr:nucleoside recognition domain protein [Mycoplasma sp. CAG:877]